MDKFLFEKLSLGPNSQKVRMDKFLFEKLSPGPNSQKVRKSTYQGLLVLSSFTGYL